VWVLDDFCVCVGGFWLCILYLIYSILYLISYIFSPTYLYPNRYFISSAPTPILGARRLHRLLYCMLYTIYYVLHTTYYILHTTYYILHTTYYILHTYYLLLLPSIRFISSIELLSIRLYWYRFGAYSATQYFILPSIRLTSIRTTFYPNYLLSDIISIRITFYPIILLPIIGLGLIALPNTSSYYTFYPTYHLSDYTVTDYIVIGLEPIALPSTLSSRKGSSTKHS
jgi:hypothetical protein